MLDILNIFPDLYTHLCASVSVGIFFGFLAIPPVDRKRLRLSFHKRGGMWFFRVGKLGGSFYLSSK